MKTIHTAKMDPSTISYSLIFGGICVASIALLLFFNPNADEGFIWFPIVILFAALISSYLMIPKIGVDPETIYIKNTFVHIKIPLSDIEKIERFDRIGFNIRTFGVGGLFGYFGYFNGSDVWYVTNIKKKVKITMKSKKVYMISPENPGEFIREIHHSQVIKPQ